MTRQYLAVGVESTFGSPASSVKGIKVQNFTGPVDRGIMYDETIDSALYNLGISGSLGLTGTFEGVFRWVQWLPIMEAFFGAPTAEVYSLSTPKSLTMEVTDDRSGAEKALQYVGVGLTRAEFTMNAKEFVRARFNYRAHDVTQMGTPTTPINYDTAEPAICFGITATLRSGASVPLKSITMTVDRKLDEDYFIIGSNKWQGLLINGVADVGGTLTIHQAHWTEYQRAIFGDSGTPSYTPYTSIPDTTEQLADALLTVVCKDPAGGNMFTIDAPSILYSDTNREMRGRGAVDRVLNYKIIGDTFTFTDNIT